MINFPVGLVALTLAILRPWIYLFLMTLVFVLQWFSQYLFYNGFRNSDAI